MPQKLGTLPLRAKIKFGSIYGEPIVWIIGDKNHSGYPSNSITLVTNQIIKLICFDAKESVNENNQRRLGGNNRYIYSNLRQWLNSDASAGKWYTAQHSADAPPNPVNVDGGWNPSDTIAGFLNAFTVNERAALLSTTVIVNKSPMDGGGTETCIDKIFLLSRAEMFLYSNPACGESLPIFRDHDSRIATASISCVSNSNFNPTSSDVLKPSAGAAWYYYLREADADSGNYVCGISTSGDQQDLLAYFGQAGLRPVCNLSADQLVSDSTDRDGCYTLIFNQPPTAPDSITVPEQVFGGQLLEITWGQGKDPEGALSGYTLERKNDGGAWVQVYKGSGRSHTDSITYGWTNVQYRVKAYDSADAKSAYTTSAVRTVTNNRPPVIGGEDRDLGSFVETAPKPEYIVNDPDDRQITVTEKLDEDTLRTYTATPGQTNTITISEDAWLKLRNGVHTLTITATDSKKASVTRKLTFTKAVTNLEFVQSQAMCADAMPTKALVNIQGKFPSGSTLTVWICNNGNDDSPIWEEITQKALNGQKHYFTNQTKTASEWGVKLKAKLLRGSAEGECYIQSIGGNFA